MCPVQGRTGTRGPDQQAHATPRDQGTQDHGAQRLHSGKLQHAALACTRGRLVLWREQCALESGVFALGCAVTVMYIRQLESTARSTPPISCTPQRSCHVSDGYPDRLHVLRMVSILSTKMKALRLVPWHLLLVLRHLAGLGGVPTVFPSGCSSCSISQLSSGCVPC